MMAMRSARRWRSVAITDAGSGLGREIALGFAAKGCVVFGTAMSAAQVQDLREASGGRVSLAVCDITREDAVRAWAGGVSDALDGAGLDTLISNAGIPTPGPIEILALDAIRHEFEVNMFGGISVINAFLPALRIAHGRIVQISSWMASVPLPFNGASGASRAAMEVLSTVYRAELRPFGIDVVVISAGSMKTDGAAETAALARVADGMTSKQRELYGKAFATFADRLNSLQAGGIEPSAVAARVIEIAEQHPAPSRAAVGSEAEEMFRMAREKFDAELDKLCLQFVGPR